MLAAILRDDLAKQKKFVYLQKIETWQSKQQKDQAERRQQ